MIFQLTSGSLIKQVRKIFRKTNIFNPLISTRTCVYQELEILVFRKILRTYLMDDPFRELKTEFFNSLT